MKIKRYILFYFILAIVCISQIVWTLGRSGQTVHASEELSYLQKRQTQLQQDINQHLADQAQQTAISSVHIPAEELAQYQPILPSLALKPINNTTISLNTESE